MQRRYVGASGLLWTYIFTKDGILKLKTQSIYSILLAMLPIILITYIPLLFFNWEKFLRFINIVAIFIYFPIVIVYLDYRAKILRKKFSVMDEKEIIKSDKIVKKIEYGQVNDFDLRQGKIIELKLRFNDKEIKVWFNNVSYEELKEFLSLKITNRLC